jgi:hypothetical protein
MVRALMNEWMSAVERLALRDGQYGSEDFAEQKVITQPIDDLS